MHTYLWTAKDQLGRPTVRRLTAETVRQAKTLLLSSGCTEPSLQTDEMMENSSRQWPEMANLSAEEQFRMLHQRPPTVGNLIAISFRVARGTAICALIIAILGFCLKDPFKAILGLAGILFVPGVTLWAARPGFELTRLNFAKAWCRWEEVLRRVEKLKRLKSSRTAGIPEAELARLRAQALAGLGHSDDALREFQTLHQSLATPEWLYLSEMGGLYEFMRRYDDALATYRRAIDTGPENSNLWINYAFALIHYKRNATEARIALQRAEAIEIIEFARPKVALTQGLIARHEGDLTAAKNSLEKSLCGLLASPHRDLAEAKILITKAYLVSIYSSLGDKLQAHKFFAETEAYLRAAGEAELLAECERALKS